MSMNRTFITAANVDPITKIMLHELADILDVGTIIGGDAINGYSITALPVAGKGVRQGAINISMSRDLAQDFVWDGNPDCAIKAQVYNYAANAANEGAVRGLDFSARNRGTNISWCNGGSINARNDSGKTCYSLIGIQTRLENYGTLETEAVGIDVNMSIENDTGAPVKDAIRVRNTDQSGMSACNSVLAISNTSTNGFTFLCDLSGLTAATGTLVSVSGTVPTNFSGRVKIKLPSGADAWIPCYSTSNE